MRLRYFAVGLLIFATGCVDDAPRDNPLDPLSVGYSGTGSLSGVVRIANQSTPVAGAIIADRTENIFVTTDSSGNFVFRTLSPGAHHFVCTKQNFTNDTFFVDIQPSVSASVVRGLNGSPVVLSQNILTRKIDQYFPSPQYFVDISADVTDPNSIADLDSVWFGADTLRFSMTYSVTSKTFIATIYKYQLPTNTIQWLVGKPLHIISQDKSKSTNISESFFVTRVIEQTASPVASNTDSANTLFVLRWTPPDVTFNYSYTVALSRVDGGIQTLLRTYEGIDSFNEKFSYPYDSADAVLSPGNYVWSVTVVDDFGNYARSKESSFTVK